MKKQKQRTKIYIKANQEKNEIVCYGIEFAEFIKYLYQPIENLMIITGGSGCISCETKMERGLELFEGYESVKKLAEEPVHTFGNFCFVDYLSAQNPKGLSEEQIAELLYLGHLFNPLHSVFFEELQNRFAYLAHDDGCYCKLFCKNLNDFAPVLCGKISASIDGVVCTSFDIIGEKLLQLAAEGILIDIDELYYVKKSAHLKIYIVGECLNNDILQYNLKEIKKNASKIYDLQYDEKGWSIS